MKVNSAYWQNREAGSRGGLVKGRENAAFGLLNYLVDAALNSVSCKTRAANGVGVPGHEL